jgi:hypothetical protein
MKHVRWFVLGLFPTLGLVLKAGQRPGDVQARRHFDKGVGLLLVRARLDCRAGVKPRGGLDLSNRKTALLGGDSGAAIVPGDARGSLLWQRVDAGEMPPKKKFGNRRINWGSHENMRLNHGQEAARIDQPVAALVRDLRQRGMLDDTLVLFTTEFGRTPFTQAAANVVGAGLDHNQYGFSVWLAGGGLRYGMTYGATDEVGWRAAERPVSWPDFHATVLHLLGIDHERLTFYHNGIRRCLTNVHGQVIQDILA